MAAEAAAAVAANLVGRESSIVGQFSLRQRAADYSGGGGLIARKPRYAAATTRAPVALADLTTPSRDRPSR